MYSSVLQRVVLYPCGPGAGAFTHDAASVSTHLSQPWRVGLRPYAAAHPVFVVIVPCQTHPSIPRKKLTRRRQSRVVFLFFAFAAPRFWARWFLCCVSGARADTLVSAFKI